MVGVYSTSRLLSSHLSFSAEYVYLCEPVSHPELVYSSLGFLASGTIPPQ